MSCHNQANQTATALGRATGAGDAVVPATYANFSEKMALARERWGDARITFPESDAGVHCNLHWSDGGFRLGRAFPTAEAALDEALMTEPARDSMAIGAMPTHFFFPEDRIFYEAAHKDALNQLQSARERCYESLGDSGLLDRAREEVRDLSHPDDIHYVVAQAQERKAWEERSLYFSCRKHYADKERMRREYGDDEYMQSELGAMDDRLRLWLAQKEEAIKEEIARIEVARKHFVYTVEYDVALVDGCSVVQQIDADPSNITDEKAHRLLDVQFGNGHPGIMRACFQNNEEGTYDTLQTDVRVGYLTREEGGRIRFRPSHQRYEAPVERETYRRLQSHLLLRKPFEGAADGEIVERIPLSTDTPDVDVVFEVVNADAKRGGPSLQGTLYVGGEPASKTIATSYADDEFVFHRDGVSYYASLEMKR